MYSTNIYMHYWQQPYEVNSVLSKNTADEHIWHHRYQYWDTNNNN